MNICAKNTPWGEGTLGFFMAVDGVDKLYGVTARHVLFPRVENEDFEYTNDSEPRHNVQFLSEAAFWEHLDVIQERIDEEDTVIGIQMRRITRVVDLEDNKARAIRETDEDELRKTKRRKECLTTFLQEIERQWSSPESRILGHVKFSPKIVVSAGNPEQQFMQDIAVFEVKSSKITLAGFSGNYIDLGTKYSRDVLTKKTNFNPTNSHRFIWSEDGLLRLWDTIPIDGMRNPMDQDGDPCITVLKRGRTMNVTLSKVLGLIAYIRT